MQTLSRVLALAWLATSFVGPSAADESFDVRLSPAPRDAAMRESIARMVAFDPECLYLTHYSRVTDVRRLARHLLQLLDAVVAIGHAHRNAPDRHEAFKRELTALYTTSLREHGVDPSLDVAGILWMDIELNAQGLSHWLDREARRQAKEKTA